MWNTGIPEWDNGALAAGLLAGTILVICFFALAYI
jgi:hypothetical protein